MKTPAIFLILFLAGANAMAGEKIPFAERRETRIFMLRSQMLLNLHHHLYREARASRVPVGALAEGVEFYRRYTRKSLFNDPTLVDVKTSLAYCEKVADLDKFLDYPEWRDLLARLAPVYARDLWPRHHARNMRTIARAESLLTKHENAIFTRLVPALGLDDVKTPILIDFSTYAGPVGGYTSLGPPHTVLQSNYSKHRGEKLLEMIFHEVAHGLFHGVSEAMQAEFKQQNIFIHRDLGHALLYYMVGHLTRDALGATYTPYMTEFDVGKGRWRGYLQPLQDHVPKYLMGESELETMLSRLVSSVERGSRSPSERRRASKSGP